jgi:hypothetical protein
MINYLLNLKLVNGDGKFSVNLQVAGRPITEKSVSIRQQFANFGAQNFRLREPSQSSVTLSGGAHQQKPIFTVMQ